MWPFTFLRKALRKIAVVKVVNIVNVAAPPAPTDASDAAIRTLQGMGYTYHGAELWRPPLGTPPNWSLLERRDREIIDLKELVVRVTDAADGLAREFLDPGTEALAAIYCGRHFIYSGAEHVTRPDGVG